MRISMLLAAAAAAGLATACASTPTPYQPANGKAGYGFSETALENNRLRLTFSGNSSTDLQTVKKYVLFRAAETTLQRGYDFFIIVDRGVETETEYRVAGPVRPRLGGGQLEQSGAEYEVIADVTMFRGAKPSLILNAYDARQIKAYLEPVIVRPAIS
jgi:hypothetical protein